MNKIVLISMSIIAATMAFSFNAIACGGDIGMSVPHIHDEHAMLIHIKYAKHSELKQIDIYQIFDGNLKNNHHEKAAHNEEGKSKQSNSEH